MTDFNIRCEVSGGVTGYRSALLKSENGEVRSFDDEAAAMAEAERLDRRMNGPHARASFRYTVCPAR